MAVPNEKTVFRLGVKWMLVALALFAGIWFFHQALQTLFLFFFAMVLVIVLNVPATWMVSKGMGRTPAALISFFLMLLLIFLIGWLVVPKILEQASTLITNFPQYAGNAKAQLSSMLQDYPELQKKYNHHRSLPASFHRPCLSSEVRAIFLCRFSAAL